MGIHEEGFDRYLPISAPLVKVLRAESIAQGFRPEMLQEGMAVGIGKPEYGSKPARVMKAQTEIVRKQQIDMIVLLHRGALGEDAQVSAHSQMDQDRSPFQIEQQVLAPPPQVQQTLPAHPRRKVVIHGQSQAAVPHHGPLQAPPPQMGSDTQAGDFDLGQLGHD
jgi:hypothetical protein